MKQKTQILNFLFLLLLSSFNSYGEKHYFNGFSQGDKYKNTHKSYKEHKYHNFYYGITKIEKGEKTHYATELWLFSSLDKGKQKYWETTFGVFGRIGRYKETGNNTYKREPHLIEDQGGYVTFECGRQPIINNEGEFNDPNDILVDGVMYDEDVSDKGYFNYWYWNDNKNSPGRSYTQRRFYSHLTFQTIWWEVDKKDMVGAYIWIEKDGNDLKILRK